MTEAQHAEHAEPGASLAPRPQPLGDRPVAAPVEPLAVVSPRPLPRRALSHAGLAEADPWPAPVAPAPPAPPSPVAALWPWGLQGLAETLEVVGLALLMFLLVRGAAQNFVVDGGSMEPTFHHGQMVIVNRLAYSEFDLGWVPIVGKDNWHPFGEPEAGDVIVFRFPLSPDRDFIKRIIAVPGQTVEVVDGQVIVDGQVLDEPYLDEAPAYRYGPETVPEGSVFVLGDARNNSYDSHSWGMLEESYIIGRAEVRYWPLSTAGVVGHDRPTVESEQAMGLAR